MTPPYFEFATRRVPAALAVGLLALTMTACTGCEDDLPDGPGNCADGQSWDDEQQACVPGSSNGNGEDAGISGDDAGTQDDVDGGETEDPCEGLECDQVACPTDEEPTSLSGVVNIPSGEFPLPNVTVFVPNGELEPITKGTSCERCEDMLTGEPLVQATTGIDGSFYLQNVPVGEDIPLVIQTGKWRRKVEISNVEQCTETELDAELTRLPRNRSEGNLPHIAVSTGYYDALECLMRGIGIDDSEFSAHGPDDGIVTIYGGQGGTKEFASHFNDGETYTLAHDWWNSLDDLTDYDIIMHSCDFASPTDEALTALRDFSDLGGRVFLTDQQRTWLEDGPSDFQSVANWQSFSFDGQAQAAIDTSFSGGGMLFDWMNNLGALDANDEFSVYEIWNNVASIDSSVAERWLYRSDGSESELYFAFNTPVGASEGNQCGRVVYSDLHISAAGGADPQSNFPDSCIDGEISDQEKALVYMFFDLSRCIAPECEPRTCSDVPGNCGVHPNECGSSIDCGECCVDIDEPCTVNADCCDSLWCDDDTGLCTDECRSDGDTCTDSDQCCSGLCAISSGETQGECISP